MELSRKNRETPASEAEQKVDQVRIRIDQDLIICQSVREGSIDFGAPGVDFKDGTMDTLVTPENVDEIEATIRHHFSERCPDLIAFDGQVATEATN